MGELAHPDISLPAELAQIIFNRLNQPAPPGMQTAAQKRSAGLALPPNSRLSYHTAEEKSASFWKSG